MEGAMEALGDMGPCPVCREFILEGDEIVQQDGQWIHEDCESE